MDISSVTNSTDTFSLYKKETDQTILRKSLEEQGEMVPEKMEGEARAVDQSNTQRQGRIDFYA